MADVDTLMATCPLKHDIRVTFWNPFIQKLRRKSISYLTLYSPPLMDVKYFQSKGYIEINNGVYTNVVGVTVDKEAFAASNSSLDNRLDLLLHGNINELLNGTNKSKTAKQLDERFPFDVINLDYTDALHRYGLAVEMSPHMNAIETILKRQKGKKRFILFVTTYVKLDIYSEAFLNDLKTHFDDNINNTPDFLDTLQDKCECSSADEFIVKDSDNFFSIAILKYVLLFLKDHGYTIKNAGIKWLIRDSKDPSTNMLHLAFDIIEYSPPVAESRKAIGKRGNTVEYQSVRFIRTEYEVIKESADLDQLSALYSEEIDGFNKKTFELITPEPKS